MNELKTMLCNLPIGNIFDYAEGGGKDTRVANCYWMKVAECFDPYGHYLGCRCINLVKESGMIVDEELLPAELVVVKEV